MFSIANKNLSYNHVKMCTSQSAVSSISIMSILHYQPHHISSLVLKLLIVVALLHQSHLVSAGLCSEAQLCCNGRDSSCVVQKTPVNAIIEDLSDKPCYCDHACLKLGDCCVDFKDHCGVVDCQVGDWTPWSECDKGCGTGVTSRTRKVKQAPQNGGKHCPSLTQKRSCQGFRCHGEQGKRILHETALLMASDLKQIHSSNKSKESFWHAHYMNRHGSNEHCIEFEVIKAAKECHKLPLFKSLIEGDRIAISCNIQENVIKSNLMRNAPQASSKNSTIKAMDSNINEKHLERDSLEIGDSNQAQQFKDGLNSVSNKASMNFVHSSSFNNDKKVAPLDRCRGEGVPGRITRWRALAVPSCRGKWLRLTLGTPKRCQHTNFSFV